MTKIFEVSNKVDDDLMIAYCGDDSEDNKTYNIVTEYGYEKYTLGARGDAQLITKLLNDFWKTYDDMGEDWVRENLGISIQNLIDGKTK